MKVIITGSTGMVGKGVLIQCLEDNRIKKINELSEHGLSGPGNFFSLGTFLGTKILRY